MEEEPSTSQKKLPKKRASRSKKPSLSLEDTQEEEDGSINQSDSDEDELEQQETSGVSSRFAEMKENDEDDEEDEDDGDDGDEGDEGEGEGEENNKKPTFTEEDVKYMEDLSRMPLAAMAAHIQALDANLYELSQRETRELTRSKHLRVFTNYRRRSK